VEEKIAEFEKFDGFMDVVRSVMEKDGLAPDITIRDAVRSRLMIKIADEISRLFNEKQRELQAEVRAVKISQTVAQAKAHAYARNKLEELKNDDN